MLICVDCSFFFFLLLLYRLDLVFVLFSLFVLFLFLFLFLQALLPAVPGELLRITKANLENNINECTMRGMIGAYIHDLQYVRWSKLYILAFE
jgi:hypothetical protein